MGVEVHESTGGGVFRVGVVLVDTTTNEPLPISIYAFHDGDEAEDWLAWLGDDLRRHPPAVWPSLIRGWRTSRAEVRDRQSSEDAEEEETTHA
jgi:hypothetical protein